MLLKVLAPRMRCSRCGKKAAEVVAVARPRPRGFPRIRTEQCREQSAGVSLFAVEDGVGGGRSIASIPVRFVGETLDHRLARGSSAECSGPVGGILMRGANVRAESGAGDGVSATAHIERLWLVQRPDQRAAAQ